MTSYGSTLYALEDMDSSQLFERFVFLMFCCFLFLFLFYFYFVCVVFFPHLFASVLCLVSNVDCVFILFILDCLFAFLL